MSKVIVFQGVNSSGDHGLWISDGTAANTVELTGIKGVDADGLAPEDFRLLGKQILFQGTDTSGDVGLWTTDGTAKGTKEIDVSGAASTGLNPENLTKLKGHILFNGSDSAGHQGLWVTDGTATGTKELTVTGAFSGGLDAKNGVGGSAAFAVLGKEAFFAGRDTSGNYGLWETDGTAAGTKEIAGIAGNPEPTIIRTLGKELVFSGSTAASSNLYVSDGTTAGTHELTGISGAQSDALGGISARDIHHFGDKLLFSGVDSTGKRGLWITDGTSAGTREIKVLGGAPQSITALDNKTAVFVVKNADGNYDLYVTDGTAAGTKELTGISGANTKGIISGEGAPQLVRYHGEVYFSGYDANGNVTLWHTDGTAVGTEELSGITGAGPHGLDPSHLTSLGDPDSKGTDTSSKTAGPISQLGHALFDSYFDGGAFNAEKFFSPSNQSHQAFAVAHDLFSGTGHGHG